MAERKVIRSYEDLEVYQRAMDLLKPVHQLAISLPDYEKFDLANQMRRASKSVPTNIAEGYSRRRSAKEFRAFLAIAVGSANEMVVHLKVVQKLEYAPAEVCRALIAEYDVLGRQLHTLIDRWRTLDAPTSNLQPPGDQS